MARDFVICPFCGFEFEPEDTLCRHGCPLREACGLIRCPSCDFEFPERPAAVSWLGRILGRRRSREGRICDRVMTVGELEGGERAEVVGLTGRSGRRNALSVFGLVPGSELTLIQRRPAFVLRIGETELALDEEIAREILVRRPQDLEPPREEPAP